MAKSYRDERGKIMNRVILVAALCLVAGILIGWALRPEPTFADGRSDVRIRFDELQFGTLMGKMEAVGSVTRLSDNDFVYVGTKTIRVYHVQNGIISENGSRAIAP